MHNRKRDTKTETTQKENVTMYILMGVLLLIIVAGCIAVTVYLNSMKQKKLPAPNHTAEYFPTETDPVPAQTPQQTSEVTEPLYSSAEMQHEASQKVSETVFQPIIMETFPELAETVSLNFPEETENPIPEVIQEEKFIIIPDYSNQDGNRTEIKLQSAGLHVDRKYEYSEIIPLDAVIRTEPQAGEKAELGSRICVVISQGSEMISADMPDLVGQNLETGKELMQAYGVCIQVTEVSSSQTAGTILSQSVQAGKLLGQGDIVELTVSKGEKMGTVTYTIEIPSEESSHFVIDFFDEESNHIASSSSPNSIYADHSVMVTLEGKGTQKVYVMLQNVNTGLTAEIGSYNFYYDDGTYASIDEDVLLAVQEVSQSPETILETTEESTITTETTPIIFTIATSSAPTEE